MILFRILYCSRATGPQDYGSLTHLLRASQARNEADGVTGLLCYANPHFFQCLEGPRSAVSRVMGRIFRDPRHTDVVLLQAGPITRRVFGDWEMKLVEPAEVPGDLLRAARGTAPGGPDDRQPDDLLSFLAGLADPAPARCG